MRCELVNPLPRAVIRYVVSLSWRSSTPPVKPGLWYGVAQANVRRHATTSRILRTIGRAPKVKVQRDEQPYPKIGSFDIGIFDLLIRPALVAGSRIGVGSTTRS